MKRSLETLVFGVLLSAVSLFATSASAQSAPANPAALRAWLVGAWAQENSTCADNATVYLPDGRKFSAPAPKGFRIEGEYTLKGDVLTTYIRPSGAYKYTDPRMVQYNKTLTDAVRIVWKGPNDMSFGFVQDPGPGYSMPRSRRCPEGPGVEPWFPKVKYTGFATVRPK